MMVDYMCNIIFLLKDILESCKSFGENSEPVTSK